MARTRIALITGAAARLGRAMALSLAEHGWDIAIHYNTSAKAAHTLADILARKGRKAWLLQADLRDAGAVSDIIPSLVSRKAMPDCLINSAAAFEKDSLATLSQGTFQEHMAPNLLAPLLLMCDFAKHYKGSQGNIINITDGMAGWSMSSAFLSYSLSKKALGDATLMMARECAPRIRVNAIAPGATLPGKQDKKDTFAKLTKIIPLKRTSAPNEICDAVHYIVSAPSLTGQILSLSGGMNL